MENNEDSIDEKREASVDSGVPVEEKPGTEPPLSKNQLKKRRRWEHKMEIKRRRKQQQREAKEAKAKAEGRDLEEERRKQQRLQAAGGGEAKKKRDARWQKRIALAEKCFGVAVDCAFEDRMTAKEINSLAIQIRHCYATNRRSAVPCRLTATSVSGATLGHLTNVSGFDEWKTRGFTVTNDSLVETYADRLANLVYLTSDSDTTLSTLEDSKIYVIGGIVDRNRLKQAALRRAQSLNIATAKLPLDQHLARLATTPVLTCNHVFDILMHYRQNKSWREALLSVLPQRKGATIADDESTDEPAENTSQDIPHGSRSIRHKERIEPPSETKDQSKKT